MNASPILGVVYKGGSTILLARVLGSDGEPITQAAITAAAYTISPVDPEAPDDDTPITGHSAVPVAPSALIHDTLQLDALWGDLDVTGYNFRHEIDISEHQAFAARGCQYRVRWTLTTSGQTIVFDFLVDAI
jgi:hypothetical protein